MNPGWKIQSNILFGWCWLRRCSHRLRLPRSRGTGCTSSLRNCSRRLDHIWCVEDMPAVSFVLRTQRFVTNRASVARQVICTHHASAATLRVRNKCEDMRLRLAQSNRAASIGEIKSLSVSLWWLKHWISRWVCLNRFLCRFNAFAGLPGHCGGCGGSWPTIGRVKK